LYTPEYNTKCDKCDAPGITVITYYDKLMRKLFVGNYCKEHEFPATAGVMKDKSFELLRINRNVRVPKSLIPKMEN